MCADASRGAARRPIAVSASAVRRRRGMRGRGGIKAAEIAAAPVGPQGPFGAAKGGPSPTRLDCAAFPLFDHALSPKRLRMSLRRRFVPAIAAVAAIALAPVLASAATTSLPDTGLFASVAARTQAR